MTDAFKVVRDFEQALCDYTGAKYAVTTTSCTMALLLACKWHINNHAVGWIKENADGSFSATKPPSICIPKKTYCGVPMSVIHAGGHPVFTDERWEGQYQLRPLPVIDSARWFSSGMYTSFQHNMICVSFHWSKTLGIQQGGAILHDDDEADAWLRRARFDGRKEGVPPKEDHNLIIGHHCYMSPETAAAGLVRLANLPKHNAPLPWGPGTNSDYPDLSTMECFK